MTIQDIRDMDPCYDPGEYLPEDWEGSVIDILNIADCPAKDRLWVVLREKFIDAKTLRLFAVWCAREALKLIDKPDPRSIAARDVAERYANGEATADELAAARDAAGAAAWVAARASALAATHATHEAARASALAATHATHEAAGGAARASALAAAWVAVRAAWSAAGDAAWDTAWTAAGGAQIEQLKSMIKD